MFREEALFNNYAVFISYIVFVFAIIMIAEHVLLLRGKMKKDYKFLSESEKVIRELENENCWRCVRHGGKIDYYTIEESLREPVLTNKRLIMLKGGKIDYEIPIDAIERVEPNLAGFTPILKLMLKNGDTFSLNFIFFPPPWLSGYVVGDLYLRGETKNIVDRWAQSINNLILSKK